MSKEFVCKIDGRRFLSQSEMIEHLSNQYMRAITDAGDLSELKVRLENEFPGFLVEVSKNIALLENLRMNISNVQGHRSYCLLQSPSLGILTFAISLDVPPNQHDYWEYDGELPLFYNEQSAVRFFKRLLRAMELFAERALEIASKQENGLVSVIPSGVEYHRYHYESEYWVSFSAVYADGAQKRYAGFRIFDALESDESMEKAVSDNVCLLLGRYMNVLEGEVKHDHVHTYRSSLSVYTINGVDIDSLAKRAKRLKVTILEEKVKS